MDGGTVKERIAQAMREPKRAYRMAEAVHWLTDVARGLQYLHESRPMVGQLRFGRMGSGCGVQTRAIFPGQEARIWERCVGRGTPVTAQPCLAWWSNWS